MSEQFVKVPLWLLEGYNNVSTEAKVLWCIFRDKITYSKYFDDKGQYYYFSSDERLIITRMLNCSSRGFDRLLKELRDCNLMTSHQHGAGIRVYLTPYQDWRTKTAIVGEPYKPKLANPLNQIDKSDKPNHTNRDSIYPTVIKTNSIDNEQSEMYIPSFIDILKYWRDKGYISNPSAFYSFYNEMGWTIGNKPIYNWRKLADKWDDNEFVDLPSVFFSEKGIEEFNNLPADLKKTIETEQSISGGRIKKRTLEKLKKHL